MTIEEYLIDQAEQKGRVKGIEDGFEKGQTAMASTIVTSLLRSCNWDADRVVSIAHLPGEFVGAIKAQLEGGLN